MRRGTAIGLATALVGAGIGLILPAPTASAAVEACAPGTPVLGDYDGDRVPDPAIRVGGAAGPAYVVQLSGGGAAVRLPGKALAAFDLNGDTCSDAVLTAATEPVVQALPGTPTGLEPSRAVSVPIPQAEGLATGQSLRISAVGLKEHGYTQVVVAGSRVSSGTESGPFVNVSTLQPTGEFAQPFTFSGAFFAKADAADFATGTALSASGPTFAVGSPGETVKGRKRAGRVYLFYPQGDGSFGIEPISQEDVSSGTPETGDRFGASVSVRDKWVAIGAPGESIGSDVRTGVVHPLYWDAEQLSMRFYRAIHQDVRGVPGSNEDGDSFGSEVAIARGLTASGSYDVLISAREKIGSAASAGSVTVANVTAARFRSYHQNTAGVPGTVERGDAFGTLGILRTSARTDTVLIGAPGEDVAGCPNCGYVIRSDGKKLSATTKWTGLALPAGSLPGLGWGTAFAR